MWLFSIQLSSNQKGNCQIVRKAYASNLTYVVTSFIHFHTVLDRTVWWLLYFWLCLCKLPSMCFSGFKHVLDMESMYNPMSLIHMLFFTRLSVHITARQMVSHLIRLEDSHMHTHTKWSWELQTLHEVCMKDKQIIPKLHFPLEGWTELFCLLTNSLTQVWIKLFDLHAFLSFFFCYLFLFHLT